MKSDIDTRHGERMIRDDASILFYNHIYRHPMLNNFVGFPVLVRGYGYGAIDVFLIERKIKGRYGKGQHLCMIEDK